MPQQSRSRFTLIARLLLILVFFVGLHSASASELEQLRQSLDELLTRYTEQHPDVLMLRRKIEEVEKSQSRLRDGAGTAPDSPNNHNDLALKTLSTEVSQAYFTFDKQGTLISRPNDMPRPGPYWPTLVKMNEVKDFPYEYALYFSTDHKGKGGIWLYICNGDPTDAKNWKSYNQAVADGDFDYLENKPVANPIFADTTQGRQTETPHANIIDNSVYMTYHNLNAGHKQSTMLATSRDGINFSRINGNRNSVIIDYNPKTAPGDGHTGYFRWGPNRFSGVDYKYVGYSLHGGGAPNTYAGMWGSNNAIDWRKLEVLNIASDQAVDGQASRILWFDIDPASITRINDNEYLAITAIRALTKTGLSASTDIYEIFLSAEGNKLTRPSRKIVSGDGGKIEQPTSVVVGDTWHLIYLLRGKKRKNVIRGAVGKLDLHTVH